MKISDNDKRSLYLEFIKDKDNFFEKQKAFLDNLLISEKVKYERQSCKSKYVSDFIDILIKDKINFLADKDRAEYIEEMNSEDAIADFRTITFGIGRGTGSTTAFDTISKSYDNVVVLKGKLRGKDERKVIVVTDNIDISLDYLVSKFPNLYILVKLV